MTELKALTQSHELPPLVPGMNVDALLDMAKMLGIANDYNYNPENDYLLQNTNLSSSLLVPSRKSSFLAYILDRKGAMVLPEFRKRGFGTYLIRHCNAISDKSGDRTWLPSRPNSIHMFKNEGFKVMGILDSHIERYGGSRRDSITYVVCRDSVSA
jgi:ribosomal protein S18 acetylase RimI-like enzyme